MNKESKYKTIPDACKGNACKGCINYQDDTVCRCGTFITNRREEGLLHCIINRVIYVLKDEVEDNPMPELKAGMVVDHGSEGLCILLPNGDGSLGMYRGDGSNPLSNALFNIEEIKTVYTKHLLYNYYGILCTSTMKVHDLNKIWSKQTPEQMKLNRELKEIELQEETLAKRKAEIKEQL